MPEPKRLTADGLAAIWERAGRTIITYPDVSGLKGFLIADSVARQVCESDVPALRQHIAALEADLAAAEAACEMVEAHEYIESQRAMAALETWRKRRAERGTG